MYHIDINNAFLHGYIEENIYMKPPKGYYCAQESQFCKLKQSLYRLKQASRAWNVKLKSFLKKLGYTNTYSDYSPFSKEFKGKQTFLLTYVDDQLIIGNDLEEIEMVKKKLDNLFTIKDLGHLRYFLGIEVEKGEKGTTLHQRKFITNILECTCLKNCKPAAFPLIKALKLSIDSEKS